VNIIGLLAVSFLALGWYACHVVGINNHWVGCEFLAAMLLYAATDTILVFILEDFDARHICRCGRSFWLTPWFVAIRATSQQWHKRRCLPHLVGRGND